MQWLVIGGKTQNALESFITIHVTSQTQIQTKEKTIEVAKQKHRAAKLVKRGHKLMQVQGPMELIIIAGTQIMKIKSGVIQRILIQVGSYVILCKSKMMEFAI